MADYILSTVEAQEYLRDYCCSACWGHLLMFPTDEHDCWRVVCHRCEETPGFVTKGYADRRRSESLAELREVRPMLRKIGALPSGQRGTERSILQDLGF